MGLNFEWSDKKNGNYAIRRIHTNSNPAGKEIEPKNKTQTSTTHFFILVDKNDTDNMVILYRTNQILKTITYDYRTDNGKKSKTPYLTKEDIENVFSNIEKNKTKTISIKKTPLKEISKEYLKRFKIYFSKLLDVDGSGYKGLMVLLKNNILYDTMLKDKKNKLKKLIKETNKEIKNLKDEIIKYENDIHNKKANNEEEAFLILKDEITNLTFSGNNETLNYTDLLKYVLYPLAKKEIQNNKQSKIQERYRDRKNAESGKQKLKRGRPLKTKK